MRTTWAAVVLTAALAGCAQAASLSPAPPSIDPAFGDVCARMTTAEASSASGLEITSSTPFPDAPGCAYESIDSTAFISVEFVDAAYWDEFKAGEHQVGTIGDESMSFADEEALLILLVRVGSEYFSVVVRIPPGSPLPSLDVATSVAGAVIGPPP